MKRIMKLLNDTVWDFVKENLKLVIGNAIAIIIALLPNVIKRINSVELKINLAFVFFISFIFLIFIINIMLLAKKYKAIKSANEEFKNPANKNVNKYQRGDIVILKAEVDLPYPPKLSVYRIEKAEIVCRNKKGDLINYSPEELLTNSETEQVFREIEYRRQEVEQKNKEQMDAFIRF